MYRSDQHHQIVHRLTAAINITFYRGAQTDARALPEHRGEHALPVERIARRPRTLAVVEDTIPDHDGAAEAFGSMT